MHSQLELSPQGHLILREAELTKQLPFAESEAAGLIQLAGQKLPASADTSLSFWRGFATDFLRALCHAPATESIPPKLPDPTLVDWTHYILNAPPMRGAEYLSADCLQALWQRLLEWTQNTLRELGSINALLEKHAPDWARVGRVTFHLAENKSDPEAPFAFMASYAAGLSKSGRLQQLPLGKALKEYSGADNKAALLKLLQPIHRAAQQLPLIQELLETGDVFHPLAWTPKEAYQFLESVSELEDCGLLVRLPNWWKKRTRRPKVAATIGEKKQSSVGLNAMLDCTYQVEVDGQKLSAEEVQALLVGDDGLVLLRGQWIEVNREQLQQALRHWQAVEASAGLTLAEGMRLLAGAPRDLQAVEEIEIEREWAFVQAGEWLGQILEQLRQPPATPTPQSLRATLRPYQSAGLDWLWFCAQSGLGACLADDMGLGKTIQLLAALLRKKEQQPERGPSLLVVPASLIGNWQREAAQFAPSLRLHTEHRSAAQGSQALTTDAIRSVDLVITTYGMLTRLEWLLETQWSWVMLDEAQAIKNHSTRQSRAVRQLKAGARIALTGTPVENNLGDLWSLFDFLNPGLLGKNSQFKSFIAGLKSENQERYAPLRKLVAPYILRRMKTDRSIIADLPEKTEMKVFCGLSPAQVKLYQQSVRSLASELKSSDEQARKGLVLAYLMRFKQICNHPDQLTKTGDFASSGSAKFQRLETLCREIESRGEKALIFTQFKELTEPLEECLSGIFQQRGLILHGGTPVKKRQDLVESFQREDGPPFFVLSLKAGGTGLNLTAASHVIHFDRWWNPAIENQATDRAFRIGQKRNVLVHKFVTQGTLEEKIDQMLSEKQATADAILTQGAEKSFMQMDNDELLNFIQLDLERAPSHA